MNPQQTNLQYHCCETYTDQKMGKKTRPTFTVQRGFTRKITTIFYQCHIVKVTQSTMRGENRTRQSVGKIPITSTHDPLWWMKKIHSPNAWRKKLVLYVDGKKRTIDWKLVIERGGKPPTKWMVKHFIPALHEEDEQPWSEGVGKTVPTSWRGEQAWAW